MIARISSPRPPSDVSAKTGLVGLLGLFAWVLTCHFWPELVTALQLPGPHQRLTGPNAALMGLLAAALPMIGWSLLVEKVHLRASTGIDWQNPRKIAAITDISITKLAGLWATWTLIGALYCLARWYWADPYLFAMYVLARVMVPLFVASIGYVFWLDRVLVNPRDALWHFGAMLIGREAYEPA